MPNNPQQPNTDDFLEFDFDEDDVLVKGESEGVVSKKQENIETQEQEIKKPRNQEIRLSDVFKKMPVIVKPVDLSIRQPISEPLAKRKIKIEAPLELKKLEIDSEGGVEKTREDLIKEASMQKDKMEALGREGEGLVYGEKDEEEIEKFKKNSLTKSSFNIDFLVRTLMSRLNIVSTLKIDLISRLKNIISSFLRDVRASRATEELLQRSVESGGLNLSPEHSKQIMDFIKDEYKRIHSVGFVATGNDVEMSKRNDLGEPSKSVESPKVEPPKEESQVISKQTAREAQLGVFSDEIANSYKRDSLKARFGEDEKKDLEQWEKELAVPSNLRTPEILAPKSVKKLKAGTVTAEVPKAELPKAGEQKEPAKNDLLFQDSRREEVLKSLNEELAQNEIKIKNREKQKKLWLFRLFKRKPTRSKVESQKSKVNEVQTESKVQSQKSKVDEVLSSKFQVPSVKEIQYQQPVVRRVVRNEPNFDNRPKVEDVKVVHPHLVGPIEELSEMTVLDFRRLGSTAQDSIDRIKEKIETASKEFFSQKIAAVNGWRKSQPNQLYIELGRQSLRQKLPVEDLINQYNLDNKPTLTKEEFDLISQLNKDLRY